MSCERCKQPANIKDGSRVIRGCIIPSGFPIAPMMLEIQDDITGWNVTESVGFGLTKWVSEDLQSELSESVGFGLTKKVSEDLQDNLSESVTITNV